MKRTIPLIVLIGATGLLVPVLGMSGESPTSGSDCKAQWASGSSGKPCTGASSVSSVPVCGTKASANSGNVIDELAAILKETKSAETFLVTTMVLGRMGPEAKRALPAIIRNAERLELLDDLYNTRASADNRNLAAQDVIAALEMILDKKAVTKGRIWQNQPAASYSPSGTGPSPYYGTVAPASAPSPAWNAPSGTPMPPSPTPVSEDVKPPSDGAIKPVPAGPGQQTVVK